MKNLLNKDLIRKNVDWNSISKTKNLSEKFIEKFQDKVNWLFISTYQTLSEKFIEKYQDKTNWDCISRFQILSEQFIERWEDKVNWNWISLCQKLSKKFIERHKNKVNFKHLKYNVLTQTNIGKDWFVAYTTINEDNIFFINNQLSTLIKYENKKNILKVKIYYKNLISPSKTNKIKVIRRINNYKICGKNNGNI